MKNIVTLLRYYPLQVLFGLTMFFIFIGIVWGLTIVSQKPSSNNQNPAAVPTEYIQQANATPTEPKAQIGDLLSKNASSTGETRYRYQSPLDNRPDEEVVADDGTILFKREVVQQDAATPTITDYLDENGQPEAARQGSAFYGTNATVYIYASKGFAFIGDDEANLVLETQHFIPMSIEDYISTHGDDIQEDENESVHY